ncbi:MAG: hypothetical protein IV100_28915, partial [Myxococcales bacterium]|nr:hypothetical protein [Myxococcales bacterium]
MSSQCVCTARLLGDDCENRLPISTGSTIVSTVNATTCVGCGSCAIQRDVWREWTASCTGNATISTCGFAPFDTKLGIYRGACPSASTPTVTTESGSGDCTDFGSCGGSGQEQATLAVVSGERIIIR